MPASTAAGATTGATDGDTGSAGAATGTGAVAGVWANAGIATDKAVAERMADFMAWTPVLRLERRDWDQVARRPGCSPAPQELRARHMQGAADGQPVGVPRAIRKQPTH